MKLNPETNGYWLIDVAEQGTYEIELHQWDKPANKALDASTARVQVGDITATAEVPPNATSIGFRMQLQKGPTRMQTWLRSDDGTERGAFYIYVKRIAEDLITATAIDGDLKE